MRSEVQHLRLSGRSQNPLSSSFPIIVILGQYSSALAVDLDPETHDIHHLFFPSNASWLSPGRSTRSVACCIEPVNYLINAYI